MKRALRHLSQVVPGLLAVALAVYVLRSADLSKVAEIVRSLGFRLPLLLLPNLAVTLIEALAWWRSFEALGVRPPFFRLVGTRIVAEAVMMALAEYTITTPAESRTTAAPKSHMSGVSRRGISRAAPRAA